MKRYSIQTITKKNFEQSIPDSKKAVIFPQMIEDPKGDWVEYAEIREEFGEKCDCCGEYGHDRRTLLMGCGYNMGELGIPLKRTQTYFSGDIGDVQETSRSLFRISVCKHCRGNWMTAIKEWFLKHGEPKERKD